MSEMDWRFFFLNFILSRWFKLPNMFELNVVCFFHCCRLDINMELPTNQTAQLGGASTASAEQVR